MDTLNINSISGLSNDYLLVDLALTDLSSTIGKLYIMTYFI